MFNVEKEIMNYATLVHAMKMILFLLIVITFQE